jgi:hypothetical protein
MPPGHTRAIDPKQRPHHAIGRRADDRYDDREWEMKWTDPKPVEP